MALWTFRCYKSPDGTDQIRDAYSGKQRQAQTKLVSRLRILSLLPYEEWHADLYKELHGTAAGVAEVRFKADGVQQRVLGCRSGESEFTLLVWATEKGNKFVPLSAPATALARKAEAAKSKDRTNALWLALE
jgi:hypothetical protein